MKALLAMAVGESTVVVPLLSDEAVAAAAVVVVVPTQGGNDVKGEQYQREEGYG